MYKLVILDYDGTLIGRSGVVSDRVKKAIKNAVAKGVKVSISTGRSPFGLKPLIKELQLDVPHVFLAGALIFNPIKDLILIEEEISSDLVKEANEFSLRHNFYLEVGTADKLYYNRVLPGITEERKKFTSESDGLADLNELSDKTKVLVMRFVAGTEEEKKLVREFQKQTSDRLTFHSGRAFNFPQVDVWNITDIGVSKVSALRHLCEYLKIHPSQTIAIGDSPIDLPIIEHVGMGIAMGNANAEVKKKANWIAPGVEEDGVATALEKFI